MTNTLTTSTTSQTIADQPTASEGVVDAVADAAGTSPFELDPLARTIDPDALDSFVDRLSGGSDGSTGSVAFVYEGYDVTLFGDGSVTVSEHDS